MTLCLNAVGVEFPAAGEYDVRVLINGAVIAAVELEVIREEEPR